jgi:hypothetical protein
MSITTSAIAVSSGVPRYEEFARVAAEAQGLALHLHEHALALTVERTVGD